MPELPEMETYRRLLSRHIEGKVINNSNVNREKSINVPIDTFITEIVNKQITSIERRAKHLIFHLSSDKVLLLHLMLGGWMYFGKENDAPDRTKQVILSFNDKHLYFIGLRLGYIHLLSQSELKQELSDLGPEPLGSNFNEHAFLKTFEGKRGRLKTTLVDQQVIAGIGNCYSDEICFEAKVKPDRKFNELKEQEFKNLFQSIKSVLQTAVTNGGYMENPLLQGDKLTGSQTPSLKIYNREGQNCIRCNEKIIRIEISSRKSFLCPNCQQ
jgi:formamidopyrimidine-DNA glycosylase